MSYDCEYTLVEIEPPVSYEDTKMSPERDSSSVTRKWEIFAGRNRFYCDGRLITAPHSGVFCLTVALITGTSAMFFVFDCPFLADRITIAIPIIGAVLFLFTMSALLRTSLTDPGIIPRATPDEAAYIEKQIEVPNSANSPTYRPPPRTKEVLVKGQPVKLKYCFTCKIFRPPRASHCSLCDNCVDRFDHHCPWVGNCVGKRNYRFFYMFIVSLAFLAVFIFACAITHLILLTKDDNPFLEAVKMSPASVIIAVICFFSVWSILGLAGFHTYLTTSNQTTNEDIKGSFTSKRGQESFNPYSHGNVCLNCFYVLCGPVAPSLIDRRGVVTDEYRSEMFRPAAPLDNNVIATNKTYGTVKNGISQISLNSESASPGVYRQSLDQNGMYSPFRKYALKPYYMTPSRNCASQKIIPSHQPHMLQHSFEFPNKYIETASTAQELMRYSNSLPRIRQGYVAGHGTRHIRPKSSYVYQNIHARDEFCVNNECNINRTKSDRVLYSNVPNVKVRNFPMPQFSPSYVQDNHGLHFH